MAAGRLGSGEAPWRELRSSFGWRPSILSLTQTPTYSAGIRFFSRGLQGGRQLQPPGNSRRFCPTGWLLPRQSPTSRCGARFPISAPAAWWCRPPASGPASSTDRRSISSGTLVSVGEDPQCPFRARLQISHPHEGAADKSLDQGWIGRQLLSAIARPLFANLDVLTQVDQQAGALEHALVASNLLFQIGQEYRRQRSRLDHRQPLCAAETERRIGYEISAYPRFISAARIESSNRSPRVVTPTALPADPPASGFPAA